MKTHTNNFKEQIKKFGRQIDSRITFGSTVLGKDDLNAVTPSYQGAILKSVMKQLDIDSNVAIPIGTILKYEFGLKVNGEYEYINYGNYIVYSIEKQEDTNSYKIVCYDKLLYSMLDYVKLPITYPILIRDYINAISTALGLKFANKSETFANYNKQIQADLYDGLGYTFRDVLDELAQVTASTICLNNNDELEIRYITETGDTIDEEFLKDVNVNFGEKFGAVNTIVLSRSGDSDSVYYPPTLPANPYEIKISDNQIMNGNDRADFLPDIYDKLNGLEFYTNDFVSTGICYYDLCDRYSVKVGDNTYSCVMLNDEVLVTQGLEENVYTELPEQTETDYKHASKDDRMINQVYIIAKKNEAEILALVSTTETIQKEINPTKDESGSEIIIEDASNNPLTYLEIEGKSTQETRNGKNLLNINNYEMRGDGLGFDISALEIGKTYTFSSNKPVTVLKISNYSWNYNSIYYVDRNGFYKYTFVMTRNENIPETEQQYLLLQITKSEDTFVKNISELDGYEIQIEEGTVATKYETYGVSPSPDYPSEIKSVGIYNEETGKTEIEVETVGKNLWGDLTWETSTYSYFKLSTENEKYTLSIKLKDGVTLPTELYFGFTQKGIFENGQRVYWVADGGIIRGSNKDGFNYLTNYVNEMFLNYISVYPSSYRNTLSNYFDIQLEESDKFTSYVPHQESISVLQLNAPLRSLPNGVKDIAYIRNNKLYVDRYVGSVVLDGSESWGAATALHDGYMRFSYNAPAIKSHNKALSNYFKIGDTSSTSVDNLLEYRDTNVIFINTNVAQNLSDFKTWLSTHNTQVDYELATPVTEELGEIEMLKTLKGYNNISTTDKLLPIINLTYVRDTIIADYVENHVAELKLTENEIKASVESVSSSVDGLNTTINRVEETTTDNSQVINIISTNIDRTTGEVREVTTTTGFTFNAEGMTIDDGSGFRAQHRAGGTYYKDGESIVGQYTKDGSKQKDLELFGTYSYGKESIDDTPMFVGQLYTDENGEQGFGHFYNGEG